MTVLPLDHQEIRKMEFPFNQLRWELINRRLYLRTHRDILLDARQWLMDFYLIFSLLEGAPKPPTKLLPYQTAMERCERYYDNCNAESADPVPDGAILDRAHWDNDVASATLKTIEEHRKYELVFYKLCRIQHEINQFAQLFILQERGILPITTADYRRLYAATLPEKVPADFRLPPKTEYLGQTVPFAGRPNFWNSHLLCQSNVHDFSTWGPCRPNLG